MSFSADESLIFKLIRLANLYGRPFDAQLGREHAITLTEWRVLLVISAHPGCVAADVADHSGFDKMTVSRALNHLETAERVTRTQDRVDGRRITVELSKRGRLLCARIAREAVARERALLAPLSARARTSLEKQIERLINHVRVFDAAPKTQTAQRRSSRAARQAIATVPRPTPKPAPRILKRG